MNPWGLLIIAIGIILLMAGIRAFQAQSQVPTKMPVNPKTHKPTGPAYIEQF
jgi:DNA-directed RNA polymerase subunit K/omega